MFSVSRAWHLLVLGLALFGATFILWRVLAFPFDEDTHLTLHINTASLSFYWVSRSVGTAQFVWTFFYFRKHCVIATREESTKIITKA